MRPIPQAKWRGVGLAKAWPHRRGQRGQRDQQPGHWHEPYQRRRPLYFRCWGI